MSGKEKTCGVCMAYSVERSSVEWTRPCSTRLMVSLTGTAAMAAWCSCAASSPASSMAGVTSGRAPSWIITHPVCGTRLARAARPLRTESCRRVPPATTAIILRQPSFRHSAAASSTRSALSTSTMVSMSGEASKTSMVRASTMRPARDSQSLSRPSMRRLEPAAAINAEAVTGALSDILFLLSRRRRQ